MSNLGHFGLMVGRQTVGDETFFAEVVPSGEIHWWRRFLPWVGNWWYEVQSDKLSYAYEEGGSGGAYTLRACIRKADEAVEKFAHQDNQEGEGK